MFVHQSEMTLSIENVLRYVSVSVLLNPTWPSSFPRYTVTLHSVPPTIFGCTYIPELCS